MADLTYVRTFSGWVYVAFVLDVYSRMIVGWQVSTRLYTDLALDALRMGIWRREHAGQDLSGLTHHSDRGVQYRAISIASNTVPVFIFDAHRQPTIKRLNASMMKQT